MSDAVTIRRARAGDAGPIARVRVDGWRNAYRGKMPQAYLDAMSVSASAPMWERVLAAPDDRVTVYVAELEGAVAGFAAGNRLDEAKHGFDAELTAIYLDLNLQRQGLGRRLVGAVAADRVARGATGLLTWVLANHAPGRRFYEALGAELVLEQPFEWDGIPLVEAGYGWRDPAALVAATGFKALH